nr:hypothetical protein B0A51_09849 [Rachicladosporium sp. CCFEE 5018]
MVLGHRKNSLGSARSSTDQVSETDEDETVVSSEQGNVISHIIAQLRPGADLSRITLPTFILEPRSMLERITNFMAHPDQLLHLPTIDDPLQRFVAVTKFYLSGWHIKPPGVKKPLNPILGEVFTGWWDYPDGTRGYYISEQTCHHPPKSSYFFMAPEHHIRIDGTLKPRSKFLGNSAGSFMEGIAVMRFTDRNERYFITQPNMYARGILFGKMKYELGDHAVVRCPETGLEADVEFKVKGWVGGTYNAIGGNIKDSRTGKALFELSGFWHGEMFIKDLSTGKKQLLFDASSAKPSFPKSRPLEEQDPRESQRLWDATNKAIKKSDHRGATDTKTAIEEQQRAEATERGETEWKPKLFTAAPAGDEEKLDWVIDAKVDPSLPAEQQVQQILAITPILPLQLTQKLQQGSRSEKAPTNNTTSQHTRPQTDGANDLIDFGQNEAAASHAGAQQTAKSQPQQLQQPMIPTQQSASQQAPTKQLADMSLGDAKSSSSSTQNQAGSMNRAGQIVRQDSLGNEEAFVDAES